jgi:hypothetical protein
MKTLFERTVTRFGHLSDETLTRLINGEMSSFREFRTNAHLNKCWQCKARREALEKASFQVVEFRKYQMERRLPLNLRRRETFLARLDEVWDETAAASWHSRLLSQFRLASLPSMNPVYASTFVVAAAAVLLFFIWHRQTASISAAVFLEKAVQAEARQNSPAISGVIYQKVEIRKGAQAFDHAIYRDIAQKRKPRPIVVSAKEESVRTELASGGVDWQQPLSAADYRRWHDSQTVLSDEVRRQGDEFLTLTTTVSTGPIAAESLTVRLADFHPIERTVALRADETVEIAELHYDVLGWDAVNDGLFEPVPGVPVAPSVAAVLAHLPSAEQLDLAELQARLVLNELHADSTEQLEFIRSPGSIEIKGVVDSDARKQQLVSGLKTVPHVVPAIFSVEDLSARRTEANSVSSVRAYSTVVRESPLEHFLRAQGKGTEELNSISQRLLDAALSMKQEGTAIDDLQRRFGNDDRLDEKGRTALQQLLSAHAMRLIAAADTEDKLLSEATGATASANGATTDGSSIAAASAAPLQLCKELIAGRDGEQRDISVVAADLLRSTQVVRHSLRDLNKSNAASTDLPSSDKP